jgi:hypothetical protein
VEVFDAVHGALAQAWRSRSRVGSEPRTTRITFSGEGQVASAISAASNREVSCFLTPLGGGDAGNALVIGDEMNLAVACRLEEDFDGRLLAEADLENKPAVRDEQN